METESFALEMKNGMSGPAKEMVTALESLKSQMKGVGNELLALQSKQIQYKDAGLKEHVKAVGSAMGDKRIEAKKLNNQFKELTAQQKAADKQTKDLAKEQRASAKAAKELGAASNESSEGILSMAGIAGGAAGIMMQLTSAALDLAKSFVHLVLDAGKLALEAGTFKVKMTNVFGLFRDTTGEAKQTYEMINRMSKTLPIPREKAFESAKELLEMGIKGQNRLGNTVQAVADLQAVMGDQAAGKLKSIIDRSMQTTMGGRTRGMFAFDPAELTSVGVSVDQFYAVLGKKFHMGNAEVKQALMYGRISAADGIDALNEAVSGGQIGKAAKDALLDPTVMFQHFKNNISNIFSGVEDKPFLEEVRKLINLFDTSTASGQGLKAIVTTVFGDGLKMGKSFVTELKLAFLKLELAFLDGIYALRPFILEMRKLKDNQTVVNMIGIGFDIIAFNIEVAVAGLAIAVGTIASMLNLVDKLVTKMGELADMAPDITGGLSAGLKGGGGVMDAAGDLAGGIIDTFTDVLGIQSPSKEMAKLGAYSAQGFEQGLNTLNIKVPAPQVAKGGGGGAMTVTVEAPITITGVAGAAEIMPLLGPAVADMFQRIAEELGDGDH